MYYSLSIILVLITTLSFFPRAHASLFNLFSNPAITQDVVWLYANSSSISEVATNIPAVMYDDDVRPASNLTQPSGSGLRGILYDRGKSCPSQQQQQNITTFFNNDYQHSIPRVALVKGGGPCTFVEKIKLAQQDGAQGVVAFSEEAPSSGNTFPGDYVNNEMYIPSDTGIAIPVYHIDPDMGIHLQNSIADLASKASSQQQQAIRVLLLPGNSHGPNPWELTLIIMIVLLGIGFITSVGMHFHLVRKNRILRQQVEAGLIPPPPEMLPMGKQLLDSDQLDKMPTRTIGGEEAAQEQRAVRRKASRVSNASKIDTSAIHNNKQQQEDNDVKLPGLLVTFSLLKITLLLLLLLLVFLFTPGRVKLMKNLSGALSKP